MKKFRQFKHVEKKEKKSKTGLYLAIFISVIMIGGVAGIFLSNPASTTNSFGKYDFTNVNNKWATTINGNDVSFYFLPNQVDNLNISSSVLQSLKGSQGVVMTFNPDINTTQRLQALDVFRFELTQTLLTAYPGKKVGYGVAKISSQYTLPVITCANSSYYFPVLYIDYGNETTVKLKNDCIVISAVDEYSMLGIMDNLRYKLYGVIK